LKGADLSKLTSKKVRKQLEDKFDEDLTARRKEIDGILMKLIDESNAEQEDEQSSNESSSASESSDDDDDDSSSSSDKKKPTPKSKTTAVRKRQSSQDKDSKSKPKKAKIDKTNGTDKPKKKTGFGKEMILSEELSNLMGTDKLSRGDVVKKMYAIFKERDLLDPSNKQFVICDEELSKVFGVKRFRAFGMMKHLKRHVKDPKDVI